MTDAKAIFHTCYFDLHVFLLRAHLYLFFFDAESGPLYNNRRKSDSLETVQAGRKKKKENVCAPEISSFISLQPWFVAHKCDLSCHARISPRRRAHDR